MNNISYYLGTL